MAMVLREVQLPASGRQVIHVAPEAAIADILIEKFGLSYVPADLAPDTYTWSKVPVRQLDLTKPEEYFTATGVQGFVHSHVFEHLPGSIDRAIAAINAVIVPGGFHLFQVPVHEGWYREDMNPDMPPQERERLFFQADHLRVFGEQDFEDRCLSNFAGFDRVDLAGKITPEALQEAAVPGGALTRFTGHTPFLFIKYGAVSPGR
jgi:hypothetical protein